jgi:predicted  nucleic acid-binding Zn-ribbon protein
LTSLDKIRESLDEVVAQIMVSHADQLRNEVSARLRVLLEEDAKQLSGVEQQLRERSDQAQSLEQQLAQTRGEIADEQKHVETVEQQLRDLQNTSGPLQGRVGELENTLKSETERLDKHRQELEQLLEISQEEVKQVQKREEEQKDRLQELEKQIEERGQTLQAKEQEFAAKTADYEQQLENGSKAHAEALQSKEEELKVRITELEQALEKAASEAHETLEGKERELLEQVHLLEELLVQGQYAREQQLEAKDREVQETLSAKQAEYDARIQEVQAQLADRDKLLEAQGGELHDRVVGLEKELAESKKQLDDVRKELQDTQAAFEKAQQQLDQLNASAGDREGALREELEKEQHQAADLEKRIAEYSAAEQAWQKREQELLGHRDKVLSSSAEASQAGQKAVEVALEEQARLQTQLDALLEELDHVRGELEKTQVAHRTREQQLTEEVASVRKELAAHGGASPAKAVHHPHGAAIADDSGAIHSAVEKLHGARSQTEILKALLEGAAQFAGRSGILVVHGRTATGWAGRGFGADGEFRRLSMECNSGVAARVVQGRKYVRGHANEFDQKLVSTFGAPKDGHAYVFPLLVRDRVAAFFYADCGTQSTHEVSTSSIDALVHAAGAWLDEIAGKGSSSKPVSESSPLPLAVAAAAAPSFAEPKAVAASASAAAVAEPPVGNTDASRQRARRFAKLLVDEIKLYNKDAVEAGRRNNDLYDRLRESIDKSRASYDKRWGKAITDVDYFREELVRNLAENNAAVFGNNFPS